MCNPVSTKHPELLLAKGVHEGFEYEVTNNRIGYRCGYVRIPAGHPWHGKDYDSVDPYPDVHGGLTFAEADTDCGKGGEDNAWWLGFDCAHAGDAPDPALDGYSARMFYAGDTIRTTPYVIDQCISLANQAKAAATGVSITKPRACSWSGCGKVLHAAAGFLEVTHQPTGDLESYCSLECLHWQLHEELR